VTSVATSVNARRPRPMGRRRESTPLKIGEVQTPTAQVLFEDAVLFPEIRNHLKLAAIHPPGEGDEQDLPSNRVEHPPSLPAHRGSRNHGAAEFSDSTGLSNDS
jgi:hypothetical protein